MRVVGWPIDLLRLDEIREIQSYLIIQTLEMIENRWQFILLQIELLLQICKILLSNVFEAISQQTDKLDVVGNVGLYFYLYVFQFLFWEESICCKDLIDC